MARKDLRFVDVAKFRNEVIFHSFDEDVTYKEFALADRLKVIDKVVLIDILNELAVKENEIDNSQVKHFCYENFLKEIEKVAYKSKDGKTDLVSSEFCILLSDHLGFCVKDVILSLEAVVE